MSQKSHQKSHRTPQGDGDSCACNTRFEVLSDGHVETAQSYFERVAVWTQDAKDSKKQLKERIDTVRAWFQILAERKPEMVDETAFNERLADIRSEHTRAVGKNLRRMKKISDYLANAAMNKSMLGEKEIESVIIEAPQVATTLRAQTQFARNEIENLISQQQRSFPHYYR